MDKLVFKNKHGFTLIELLVVIAVVSLISSAILASLNSARVKARDARRQTDLKQIQVALELYYDSNLSYPFGCWNYYEKDGSNFIPGLVPNFMPVLPRDSLQGQKCPGGIGDNTNWRTYYYCSNGAEYKVNVCSELPVPANSVWWDKFRPGYAYAICSSQNACQNF